MDFIEKAKEIHKELYDYSKVNYINSRTKVEIICNKHGSFWQTPNNHLRGQGCMLCYRESIKKPKYTFEIFVDKAQSVHSRKYTYHKNTFINMSTPTKITCKEHGDFYMIPSIHLQNHGCKQCGLVLAREKQASSQASFIEKAQAIHKDIYDYSKVNYINSKTPVDVICKSHGIFKITPNAHLLGQGCRKCRDIKNANLKRKPLAQYISEAKEVFGSLYDYSKVNYVNNSTNIEILCSIHGSFWKRPIDHLKGQGCPKCNSSLGEKSILEYLIKKGISFQQQKQFPDLKIKKPLRYDFYIPNCNLLIEYNGIQHYQFVKGWHKNEQGFHLQKHRDWLKRKYAKDHNIQLLCIKYTDFENIYNILSEVI